MSWVSIIGKDGKYEAYTVPDRVYIYIGQLEAYIRNPEQSKLKEVYKDRFDKTYNKEPETERHYTENINE